jgi:hypothetical protein
VIPDDDLDEKSAVYAVDEVGVKIRALQVELIIDAGFPCVVVGMEAKEPSSLFRYCEEVLALRKLHETNSSYLSHHDM